MFFNVQQEKNKKKLIKKQNQKRKFECRYVQTIIAFNKYISLKTI